MSTARDRQIIDGLVYAEVEHCASDCCDNYPHLHVHGSQADQEALRQALNTPRRPASNSIEAPDPLGYSEEYRRGWYAALHALRGEA